MDLGLIRLVRVTSTTLRKAIHDVSIPLHRLFGRYFPRLGDVRMLVELELFPLRLPRQPGAAVVRGMMQPPATVTSCAKNSIKLEFNPMYSAYDGVHKFQIPVITQSIDGADLTWSASDPSMVDFAPETITPYHGVMVTTRKAGTVSIIASAGSLCGSSLLTITAATPDDWEIGNARYNSGEVVSSVRGQIRVADGGDAKCTNCHGDTAMSVYKTVSHSPVQTGGFSDDELVNIFQHGNVPEGGVFDEDIVSYNTWHQFHQWGLSDDEARRNDRLTFARLPPCCKKGCRQLWDARRLRGRLPHVRRGRPQ